MTQTLIPWYEPMLPIEFQVVGEEEYAFAVQIDSAGGYVVHSGSYATQPPRSGTLSRDQQAALLSAVETLGIPPAYPMPVGTEAFEARLTIGEQGSQVTYRFWEGALETDANLKELVRLLERL